MKRIRWEMLLSLSLLVLLWLNLLPETQAVTLTFQVSTSTDDAGKFWDGSWQWSTSGSGLGVGYEYNLFYRIGEGLRFTNINIPQGTTISSAYLKVKSINYRSAGVVRSRIHGEAADNTATFSTLANYDGRVRTTAVVDWDGLSTWVDGNEYTSPNIASVVQEIINRAGWSSGNALVIFWDDHEDRSDHVTDAERNDIHYDYQPSNAPKLEITVPLSAPSNDELTFTDPDGGKALAQHKAYSFRTKHTDLDGGTNIDYVDFTLDYGGEDLKLRWTESTDTFSEVTDPMGYISLSSTGDDSSLSGNQWTLIWKITFDWDYPDESLHSVQLYVIDDTGYFDTDLYNDKYQVENDLTSSGLTVSDYRVNPSQSLTFSGYWYYEGTSIAPPDSNYHVKVKLGAVEKGEDATLISGAFSLAGIIAESSVASYVYTTTADYMAISGSFLAVVVDKISVTITASDNTPAINQTVTFSVSGKYAYDNTPVSTLSFQITRNGSNYSTTTPFTDMQSTFVLYNYTTSSASETTYTLNTFTTNTQNVGWGYNYTLYGAYNENGIRTGAINVTFYRHNQASQNILLDGSYTFQSADYLGSVFQFNLGYNESRTYYLRLPSENIYVFKPYSPYYTYFFTVIDMAGIHNGYLESIINVNGTDRVVERWSLVVLNNIPFTMEWSRAYTMKLICDEGTYVFGTFVAGAQTSFQLPVYKALFPQDLVAVEGVYINALRINDTRIQMNYTDSLLKTNWVQVSIYQLPAKQLAYTTNNTGQTQMINWDLANPKANYWVVVTVSSQQFGSNTWQFVLSSILSNENPWDALNWLGSAPFPLSQIFGFGIVLLIFGVFSQEHAAMAGIVGVLVAAVLTVIGMLSIAASWLAVTMGIAILVAISINRKRAEAG